MVHEPYIYLDYNATTPVDPEVMESMRPWFTTQFANSSSRTHFPGRQAAEVVENARQAIAEFLGCESGEIIFTSGATESINIGIRGVAGAYASKGKHIISWVTEHTSVLDVLRHLGTSGYEITLLPVNREGLPDAEEYKKALRSDTMLTIMMLANNETGVVMPVKEFSSLAHEHQSLFFCDATQACGKMRVNVGELGADLLCLSAHKMYGPKGTGALYIRRKNPRVTLTPILFGGGHESGFRPGTLNVPGIAGMAKAAELAGQRYWDDTSRISKLRTLLEQQLTANGQGYVNGSVRERLPNTTNILFPGFRAESIMTRAPRLAVATGSACTSALPGPSHVLRAMGLTTEESYSSIRFSLGRPTTEEEIAVAVDTVLKIIMHSK